MALFCDGVIAGEGEALIQIALEGDCCAVHLVVDGTLVGDAGSWLSSWRKVLGGRRGSGLRQVVGQGVSFSWSNVVSVNSCYWSSSNLILPTRMHSSLPCLSADHRAR